MSLANENKEQNTLVENYKQTKSELIDQSLQQACATGDCENCFKDGKLDYKKEYSDEFYSEYIKNFKTNAKKRYVYRFFKRFFDILFSLLLLIILSPVFIITSIAILCDSKGGVIFKQKRLGRGGKPFNCYKFRSMYVSAPKNCATSLLNNPEKYLTRVGKVIRKLSIDELPQLWCVFIGTMSFIGYRPLVLTEEKCNDMRNALGVFKMRPGISGYAQVYGRDDVHYKNKAIMDAEYVNKASLWLDLKLVFKTVGVVFNRKGNHDDKKKKQKNKKD